MYSSSEPIDPSVLRLVQQKSLVRIVDDDETVAKSYEFMLRCTGWNCRIFNSAEDYLVSENVQIGCLILDVRMPGLSGLQLQQKARDSRARDSYHLCHRPRRRGYGCDGT